MITKDVFLLIVLVTKLSLTRWKADWRAATVLYETAAIEYRTARDNVNAKIALEKASKGHEMLQSPWDAAKHMETCGNIAKELGNWHEVVDYYRRASELFTECGRSQPAADSLAKGARALQESSPEESVQLFTDACSLLEEDGRQQMAFDLYREATSVYIKLERLDDAAACLLRLGSAADSCKATNSQCKAYLSAIIVYLYAHDFKQAEKCYNDCSQVGEFVNSDQNRVASKLLSAYSDADVDEIKRLASSATVNNLDHVIIRLARKLPTGDVATFKENNALDEEPIDENDLT
ncbi:hypothetical protein ACHQM5_017938 [Ranunculus cassubicifolius]